MGAEVRSVLLPDQGNGPELLSMVAVSEGFLELLSVRPALGRTFLADDYAGRTGSVVMLSYQSWLDRHGGDPSIIGHQVGAVGTRTYTIGSGKGRT